MTTPVAESTRHELRSFAVERRIAACPAEFIELTDDVSSARSGIPTSRRRSLAQPDLDHLPHRRALDRHERRHHDLHARLRPHAAGHDVVAGDARPSCSATPSCSSRWFSTRTPARNTACPFRCCAARRLASRAQTSRRCCARSSRAAGSAFRRGSAGWRCTS